MKTEKQKKYFRSLQTQMLKWRNRWLYHTGEMRIWKDEEHRRLNIPREKDLKEHVAASLQHDLWS